MGNIRRLDANVDIQAFPGAHFIINDDVPPTQCSEAQLEGDNASSSDFVPPFILTDAGKFTGFDLTGKICTITASTGGNTGNFNILSNTDDALTLETDPGNGVAVVYYIHDGGELILTRDEASFAAFIHAAGYAYTFKGRRLFTNMPNGLLKNACTILWNPLT